MDRMGQTTVRQQYSLWATLLMNFNEWTAKIDRQSICNTATQYEEMPRKCSYRHLCWRKFEIVWEEVH